MNARTRNDMKRQARREGKPQTMCWQVIKSDLVATEPLRSEHMAISLARQCNDYAKQRCFNMQFTVVTIDCP